MNWTFLTSRRHLLMFLSAISFTGVAQSVQADQGSRYLGVFDAQGRPVKAQVSGAILRKVTDVPAGLRNSKIVGMHSVTVSRLGLSSAVLEKSGHSHTVDKEQFIAVADKRFASVANEIKQSHLVESAKSIARLYNVDAAALLGSIIGERVFNNSKEVKAQDLAAKALPAFANFRGASRLSGLLKDKAFADCLPSLSDYWSWVCINQVWNTSINKAKNGTNTAHIPKGSLLALSADEEALHAVLKPTTGKTYGIAQISPARAIMMSHDIFQATQGRVPQVFIDNMQGAMDLIFTQNGSLHIVAALLKRSIEVYRRFAGFDISKNIGIQVTLFNLGYEYEKALALEYKNSTARNSGAALTYPTENYMGWFINYKENEIRALLK